MRELILSICQSLVDMPDSVKVNEINSTGQVCLFEISVHKEDVGKIIGKQGVTARAIRTIINAIASKLKKRVVIEILE